MSFNIKIEKDSYQHITRERNEDDRWDNDDLCWEHTIRGFKVVNKKDYWDFVLDKNPKGKTLYLVYVLYNTGDSFHREENVICLIGLYEHDKDAYTVADAIKRDYDESSNNYKTKFNPIDVKLPKKKVKETISVASWKGYFESLTSVEVMPLLQIFVK